MQTPNPNVVKHGNLWIVRVPSSGQAYSCISEEQAFHLNSVLNPPQRQAAR
ncbi:MAG TPA: hypothetical protein VK447_05835 [Myxococcaceae bacterium]|nr:hypothetical protein [Myxococcaceae bacterium]